MRTGGGENLTAREMQCLVQSYDLPARPRGWLEPTTRSAMDATSASCGKAQPLYWLKSQIEPGGQQYPVGTRTFAQQTSPERQQEFSPQHCGKEVVQ